MNEKELGEALLKWDARGPVPTVDPHKVVASVLKHDRRRVRRLAVCAIVLWTLAGIGIPLSSFLYLKYMFPMINWLMQQIITGESEKTPQAAGRQRAVSGASHARGGHISGHGLDDLAVGGGWLHDLAGVCGEAGHAARGEREPGGNCRAIASTGSRRRHTPLRTRCPNAQATDANLPERGPAPMP